MHWKLRKCSLTLFCTEKCEFITPNVKTPLCGKMKHYSHRKNNSSNQLFSNFFSKTVALAKILPKMRESKFP